MPQAHSCCAVWKQQLGEGSKAYREAKEAKRTEEPAAAAAASGRGGALPDRSLLLPDSSSRLGALAAAAPASNDRRGS